MVHVAYLFTRNQRKHSLRFVERQQEFVANLIPMKHFSMSSPNRGFDIIEVIQVKVEVGVTVNQYEEQSVPLEELRVTESQSASTQ